MKVSYKLVRNDDFVVEDEIEVKEMNEAIEIVEEERRELALETGDFVWIDEIKEVA